MQSTEVQNWLLVCKYSSDSGYQYGTGTYPNVTFISLQGEKFKLVPRYNFSAILSFVVG